MLFPHTPVGVSRTQFLRLLDLGPQFFTGSWPEVSLSSLLRGLFWWAVSFIRASEQEGKSVQARWKPRSLVSHPFCHILFLRFESLGPAYTPGKELYTRAWIPGGGRDPRAILGSYMPQQLKSRLLCLFITQPTNDISSFLLYFNWSHRPALLQYGRRLHRWWIPGGRGKWGPS